MKKIIVSFIAALACGRRRARLGGGMAWTRRPTTATTWPPLQNGAKLFVNYCVGCHSAAFMRYNRLKDIGLTEQQIKDNLLFTTDKIGETMKANIDPKQAKAWFGANPPDLTVIARSRAAGGSGADYSTPSCARSTVTTPRPPAGTTCCSQRRACPRAVAVAGRSPSRVRGSAEPRSEPPTCSRAGSRLPWAR